LRTAHFCLTSAVFKCYGKTLTPAHPDVSTIQAHQLQRQQHTVNAATCSDVEQGWANIFYGGPHWRFCCYRGPHARITHITSIITLKPSFTWATTKWR